MKKIRNLVAAAALTLGVATVGGAKVEAAHATSCSGIAGYNIVCVDPTPPSGAVPGASARAYIYYGLVQQTSFGLYAACVTQGWGSEHTGPQYAHHLMVKYSHQWEYALNASWVELQRGAQSDCSVIQFQGGSWDGKIWTTEAQWSLFTDVMTNYNITDLTMVN